MPKASHWFRRTYTQYRIGRTTLCTDISIVFWKNTHIYTLYFPTYNIYVVWVGPHMRIACTDAYPPCLEVGKECIYSYINICLMEKNMQKKKLSPHNTGHLVLIISRFSLMHGIRTYNLTLVRICFSTVNVLPNIFQCFV